MTLALTTTLKPFGLLGLCIKSSKYLETISTSTPSIQIEFINWGKEFKIYVTDTIEFELSSQFYTKLDCAFESIDAKDYSEVDTIEDLISFFDEQIKIKKV